MHILTASQTVAITLQVLPSMLRHMCSVFLTANLFFNTEYDPVRLRIKYYIVSTRPRRRLETDVIIYNEAMWKYGLIHPHPSITGSVDGILPLGLYPPCIRMADRALLAGYRRITLHHVIHLMNCRRRSDYPEGRFCIRAGDVIDAVAPPPTQITASMICMSQFDLLNPSHVPHEISQLSMFNVTDW